jgi:hypothetical protein
VPVVSVVSDIWRFLVEQMDARAQEAPPPVSDELVVSDDPLDDGDRL